MVTFETDRRTQPEAAPSRVIDLRPYDRPTPTSAPPAPAQPECGWRERQVQAATAELRTLAAVSPAEALAALARLVVRHVPGASAATITVRRGGRHVTTAATSPRALMADQLQYELGQGPCVTAVDGRNACAAQWLRDDSRWPVFGRRVSDEVGFASLLSFQVRLDLPDASAALNVYSDRAGVFDHQSVEIGQLMADTARTLLRGRVTAWPTSSGWTSTGSEPPSTPPGPGS